MNRLHADSRPNVPHSHEQSYTKVNAPVDALIVDLVNALCLFPELETIESCQGPLGGVAWINFYYGKHWEHPWNDLATFILGYFGPGIAREVGDRADVAIRVAENQNIYGELTVRRDAIQIVTRAITKIYNEYNP